MLKRIVVVGLVACRGAGGFGAEVAHLGFVDPAQPDAWVRAWKPAYGCTLVQKGAPTGSAFLQQSCPTNYPKGNHAWGLGGHSIQAGATYTLRGLVRYENILEGAMVQIYYKYADGRDMGRDTSPAFKGTQAKWEPFSYTFKPPAGAASADIALRLNSPGKICWDDMSLSFESAPEVRFNEDACNFNLSNSVGIVRLFDHQKAADLNVKWVRVNATWGVAEKKGKGQWDNEYLNQLAADCRKAKDMGMDVLLSLGYPPYWASRKLEGVKGGYHVARSLDDWQTFITNVVTFTKDTVHTYRIMNEPDHQWDSGAQPAEYTKFLVTGYDAVKSVAPTATVVMAGLSGAPGGYLQAMYDAGAKDHFDIAACQPYVVGQKSPEEGHQADRLRAYRMVLAANGDNKPLWITEFGYTAEPVSPLTPREQSAYAIRSHFLALSSRAGVTKTFYYLLQDSDGDGCTRTGGMYDRQWNIKPIGIAVREMAKVFNPVEKYIGQVTLPDAPEATALLFAKGNGEHVLVVWHPTDGEAQAVVTSDAPSRRVSWEGQESAPGLKHALSINIMPVYVVGRFDTLAKRAVKAKDIGYEVFGALAKSAVEVPFVAKGAPKFGAPLSVKGVMRKPRVEIARISVAGCAEGLAIHAEVNDATPAVNDVREYHQGIWREDSLEVFVNLAPEQSPAGFVTKLCRQFVISTGDAKAGIAPRIFLAAVGGVNLAKELSVKPRVEIRKDLSGYSLSSVIPWNELGRVCQAGEELGLDFLVNLGDGKGERVDRGAWTGNEANGADASLWGRIKLVE